MSEHAVGVPRSHQTFRAVLAVKLLGIMFMNRWWSTTFFHYYSRRCRRMSRNCLVWSASQFQQTFSCPPHPTPTPTPTPKFCHVSIRRWLRPLESRVETTCRHFAKKDRSAFYGGFVVETIMSPAPKVKPCWILNAVKENLAITIHEKKNAYGILFWLLSTKKIEGMALHVYFMFFSHHELQMMNF